MSERTFKVAAPHMRGDDVRLWQQTINEQFAKRNIGYRVTVDGDYGVSTRNATATLLHTLGIAKSEMAAGVSAALRIKVRSGRRTPIELARYAARVAWRRRLRARFTAGASVASPLAKIISSSWGWTPPVHDGVDLICIEDAPIFAICDAEVVDVRASGWWGKGAQPSPGHPVSDGDGIIQIRCLTDTGPFTRGMIFGYGHAEHAKVTVGQHVKAGQQLGLAGTANVAHVHFMARGPYTGAGHPPGIGDRDPMPYVRYAQAHA